MMLPSWPYNREMFLRFWFRSDPDLDIGTGASNPKILRLGFGGTDKTYWGINVNEYADQATLDAALGLAVTRALGATTGSHYWRS